MNKLYIAPTPGGSFSPNNENLLIIFFIFSEDSFISFFVDSAITSLADLIKRSWLNSMSRSFLISFIIIIQPFEIFQRPALRATFLTAENTENTKSGRRSYILPPDFRSSRNFGSLYAEKLMSGYLSRLCVLCASSVSSVVKSIAKVGVRASPNLLSVVKVAVIIKIFFKGLRS